MATYQKRAREIEKILAKDKGELSTSAIRAVLTDLGFSYLAKGVYRIVFTHPRHECVFKVARGQSNDLKCNKTEWELYKRLKPKQRKYLARPMYKTQKNAVLVMERIPKTAEEANCRYIDLQSFREEVCCVVCRIYDLHDENIGVRESGKLVVIDYANTDELS